ncbi:uncharacterized protein BT62DRAFT_1002268 [Guyanagaster necrorhizus]|uniref:MYND-type domain-containing protein n=1 Tax=Guyanagaster necrorhizus TaxID=856835 RepID=A0A9P8AVW0_9AGAR|nr:uncharacterized protein BT62DRAFT_1002268 [Guyanagaster necrorhizus MCA 3950]KAG7449943.1 hypothetical protein BT62DRAFT_1002268 [Guyanagaster necrorhizus MCA 3950]
MGASGLSPPEARALSDEEIIEKLRYALWDSQRIDDLFHGKTYLTDSKLDVTALPACISPKWKTCPGLPTELLRTSQARGRDTPFVTYFTHNDHLLLMEILDVKQCAWPEPSDKFLKQLKTAQETKFGHSSNGPLVPVMQTPKFPLMLVRYSYMEGRPKGGSQFSLFLESNIKKNMPRVSAKQRPICGYLLVFCQITPNSFMRKDFSRTGNGISQDAVKETKISFFVPCLRLRWRVLEEIETGVPNQQLGTTCQARGKTAKKLTCNSCKSVYYRNAECNKADWPRRKEACKTFKRLLDNPSSSPPDKLYIPAPIKYSGSTYVGDSIRNEYGDERFLLRTQMPAAEEHIGKDLSGDPPTVRERGWPPRIPFHPQGRKRYTQVIKAKGIQGQLIYLWAKRAGDAVDIDLVDVSDQRKIWWKHSRNSYLCIPIRSSAVYPFCGVENNSLERPCHLFPGRPSFSPKDSDTETETPSRLRQIVQMILPCSRSDESKIWVPDSDIQERYRGIEPSTPRACDALTF